MGVKVIGVSADTADAQKNFAEKYTFPFTLLADKEGKVIDAFKVEKRANGMASRQCFIIKDGKVVWHDAKGATETQADEVKAALKDLK
jgi:peroxiredoxin Q/BCP